MPRGILVMVFPRLDTYFKHSYYSLYVDIQFNSIQNTLFVPEGQFKRHKEQHTKQNKQNINNIKTYMKSYSYENNVM